MFKKIWIALVRLGGWKFVWPDDATLREAHHSVLIMAPHTSVPDFFLGAASLWTFGLRPCIFMKKEFFVFGTRRILKAINVIPVDRGNPHNGLVHKAVEMLNADTDLTVVITPEGTRHWVKRWKRGFYEIAMQAHVPIACTYIDFAKKECGFKGIVHPSGDFDSDIRLIMAFYQDVTAKYPDGFNPKANLGSDEGDDPKKRIAEGPENNE